jgi:hypothetical protein
MMAERVELLRIQDSGREIGISKRRGFLGGYHIGSEIGRSTRKRAEFVISSSSNLVFFDFPAV